VDGGVEGRRIGISVADAWLCLGCHDDGRVRVAERICGSQDGAAEGEGAQQEDDRGGFQPGRAAPKERQCRCPE
jgi:hypothetical protein